jgi:phenylalanyl-tRNA synthetase alpha subunit
MRFDPEERKELSRSDFETAWHRGPEVLTPPSLAETYPRKAYRRAAPHPIAETIQRLREVYLSMGFDEARVPVMIEEADVYRQFGPEASAVLDRVFYLGGLPRPNVGISDKQLEEIMAIIGSHEEHFAVAPETVKEKLQRTFHAYKKATIDGDELTHEIAADLGIDDGLVVHILDSVFPEFRNLAPESSRTTLRSHMTSGWFLSLGAMWEHYAHPIRLFSIDRCFRREQEEGPTRLMSYHSASCIIAGEDVTIEDGKAGSEALLSAFGFEDFQFRPDEKRSKYYIPDTQTEVYARHPEIGWVEVATFGMYSPSALGEYGVGDDPVQIQRRSAAHPPAVLPPQPHRPRDRGGDRPPGGAADRRGAAARPGDRRDGDGERRGLGPLLLPRLRGRDRGPEPPGLCRGARGELKTLRPGHLQRGLRAGGQGARRSRHREVRGCAGKRGTDRDLVPDGGGEPGGGQNRGGGPVRGGRHRAGEDGEDAF